MQAVAAWASEVSPPVVAVVHAASGTVAVSGTAKECDGIPVGSLRFKDGALQLCRE